MGSNGIDVRKDKDVCTVLVTGFGPFQDRYPVNPSFEIARLLPVTLPSTPANPTALNIITYPHPIRVCYSEVEALVPALLDSYARTIDLVLHIGMASGRKYYAAERLAHRDGYDRAADLDGVKLAPTHGAEIFGDCPATIDTSLDHAEVMQKWQANISKSGEADLDVRSSDDPGRYLCDYIYFNSLAWFGRKNGKLADGVVEDRPVMFLHVPPESDDETLRKGCAAATTLLRAMADSWSVSKMYETGLTKN